MRLRPAVAILFVLAALGLLLPAGLGAHPFSRESYSIRQAIKLKGDKLLAVVVLEIPAQVVMAELLGEVEAARRDAEAEGKTIDLQLSRAQVDKYNREIWQKMGDQLTLSVNGQAIEGKWKPINSEANGKGGEGFFVYLVGFAPKGKIELGQSPEILLDNKGWTDVPMYYAGLVNVGDDWSIKSNSARDLLGDIAESVTPDPSDPKSWTQDKALRQLKVVFERKP